MDDYESCTCDLWVPSVLWRCLLPGRKGVRPVKNEWWGAGMVICLKRCAELLMAQLMPLSLTVSCFDWGFTFLVAAHLGGPGQRAVKWVYVHLCISFHILCFTTFNFVHSEPSSLSTDASQSTNWLVAISLLQQCWCLQRFDTVGWAPGRATGL